MKHKVQLLEGETVQDAINRKIADIENNKKPDQPGQIVVIDDKSRALKVVTHTGKGLSDQSYAAQLDVNKLLIPAQRKGLLRAVTRFEGELDDIPPVDFQEAQNIVARATQQYESMPSSIRSQFKGPAEFLAHVQNPENKDWLKKHGLLKGLDGINDAGTNTGYNPKADPVPVTTQPDGTSPVTE